MAFLVAGTGIAGLIAMLSIVEAGVRGGAQAEAQRAADAGALAGAGVLSGLPEHESLVRQAAMLFARKNLVRGRPPEVSLEDVEVDGDEGRVTVRVWATAYPIGRPLTWLSGAAPVGVSATATAEARAARPGVAAKRLRLVE